MMLKKKRYIPPYIEIVDDKMGYLLDAGLEISSQIDNDSKQSKGSYFFDDDYTSSGFIWDNDDSDEWEP